jgi:hypothetical protein
MSGQLTPRPLYPLRKRLLYPLGGPRWRAVWTLGRKISRFCPGWRSLDVYRAQCTAIVSGSSVRFTQTPYEHRETKCSAICTYLLTYSLFPPIPENPVGFSLSFMWRVSRERHWKRLDFAIQLGGSGMINGVEKVQAISVVRITCGG